MGAGLLLCHRGEKQREGQFNMSRRMYYPLPLPHPTNVRLQEYAQGHRRPQGKKTYKGN